MIIWLASYPKSGNTWVRSFIAAYYYSEIGEFDFSLLSNIKQFPDEEFFNQNINSIDEASALWIKAQKKINENKKIKFFKTHSCLGNYKNKPFTTSETTLGGIYIARDPRNIFTSIKNHFSMTDNDALDMIADEKRGLISDTGIYSSYAFISSWSNHYLSWKRNNQFRRLIIKYEDLLTNRYETFRDIIVFTNTLLNKTEGVDKKKLEKAIKTTDFDELKNKEISDGLDKSVTSFKKWRNIHKENKNLFFNLGPENNWKEKIEKKTSKKIETLFQKEMIELGYI
jgi:hypothetical protein